MTVSMLLKIEELLISLMKMIEFIKKGKKKSSTQISKVFISIGSIKSCQLTTRNKIV
jgi:hypothetical protein